MAGSYTPKQVTEILGIPESTIRRWAARFKDHLSQNIQPVSGRSHRTYTPDDVNTFRKIADLSASGHSLDAIDGMLEIIEPMPDQSTALVTTADVFRFMEASQAIITALQQKIIEQDERAQKQDEVIQQQTKQIKKAVSDNSKQGKRIDEQAQAIKELQDQIAAMQVPWIQRIFKRKE